MKRFRSYNNLLENVEIENLDGEYVKKALSLKTFSISSKDLQSTKYKKEIQFVVRSTWFPNFDLDNTISSTKFNKNSHNKLLQILKKESKVNAANLIHYSMSGIGPGEFMFYFMYDELSVGGGASNQGWINGFFMGGAVDTSALANKIHKEMQAQGIEKGGSGSGLEYAGSKLDLLKQKSPQKYSQFEREFGQLAKTYFAKETVVFINNNSRDASYGEILHILYGFKHTFNGLCRNTI